MPARIKKTRPLPPPYELNAFPLDFPEKLGKELIALLVTKKNMTITGTEWEQCFADSIGATWQSTNVGLRDVYLNNCCWSAKTVEGYKNLNQQKEVRLISGRNNTEFSFALTVSDKSDPQDVGEKVLQIWNQRVKGVKKEFYYVRQVVLVRSKNHEDYIVFEKEITTYNSGDYIFKWNKNKNLEGFRKSDKKHVFTWQINGKQFTIIEEIPDKTIFLHFKKKLPILPQSKVLEFIGYSEEKQSDWFDIK